MGGATMSLYYIIERLDRARYEPIVLFLGGEGPGVTLFREAGIKVIVAQGITWYAHAENARFKFLSRRPLRPITDFLRIPSSVWKLISIYRELSIDLVHLNTSLLIPAGTAARRAGIKVVWHIREPLYRGWFGVRRHFVRKAIIKNSDAIVAISREDASRLGSDLSKVQVIYNYVDFAKFDFRISGADIRRELNIPEDRVVICNLGGVIHSKGPHIYLKAALEVWKKCPNVVFVLVGYPPEHSPGLTRRLKSWIGIPDATQAVNRLLASNPELERVIFTGVRKDIPAILAASDVLVWSATVPHFARPIIEAGAMQKPVVAADFPNSREIVEVGVTGLLYDARDASELAAQLERLVTSPELRKDMGMEGYRKASQLFNAELNARKIYQIYDQLLQQ